MTLFERLTQQAKANKQRIVLAEGAEKRTLTAADHLIADGICDITLIGNPAEIKQLAAELSLKNIEHATIVDPADEAFTEKYAQLYYELRKAKGMTLEGAHVKCVAELLPYSGGLKRNIVQCLNDFDIPLKLSHTVVNIEGKERVSGVTIAEVGPDRKPIPGTEIHYDCDTLLLSCGLIPENELSRGMGVEISPVTNGPVVDESLQTSIPGVFAAGNVLHVHDLVDFVSAEAARAGEMAARFLSGEKTAGERIPLIAGNGVSALVPEVLSERPEADVTFMFRPRAVFRNARIAVFRGGKQLAVKRARILAPGEMAEITVKQDAFCESEGELTVSVEEVGA